jgi:hypothetical protein
MLRHRRRDESGHFTDRQVEVGPVTRHGSPPPGEDVGREGSKRSRRPAATEGSEARRGALK